MRRTPARLLTVAVLLVGLLGMHGLGHDGMTSMARAAPSAASVSAMEGVHGPHLLAAPAGLAVELHSGTGGPVHPVCVAALLGSVLLLLLALLRGRRAWPTSGTPSDHARPPAPRSLPPPDVVAGLCVCRT